MTLFPQDNGKTYLDISFPELPELGELQSQTSATDLSCFSIKLECEDGSAVDA
jgi:hypothetical protein